MIGTDINFWMFLVSIIPAIAMILSTAVIAWMCVKNPKDSTMRTLLIFVSISLIVIIWTTFGSYGPGIAPDLPAASEEGVNQRMADTPPEDVQGAAEKAESKVPPVLKQVRETAQGGPGPEKIDEDEKFRATIESALRVKSNQKARKSK